MRAGRLSIVLLTALAAGCCANPPANGKGCSTLPRPQDGPRILDVDSMRDDTPPTLIGRSGAAPAPGERFVLLSASAGYMGTIEVTAEKDVVCFDDCPRFWVLTRWLGGSEEDHARVRDIRESEWVYALNLVPKDQTRIRAAQSGPGDPPLPPGWAQSISIDLDGDQRSDIVLVRRKCDCGGLSETKLRVGDAWTVRYREFGRSVFSPRDPVFCDR